MPKSLIEFIEVVENGTIAIDMQQLVDTINNARNARTLQQYLSDDFDCDVPLRDCQLMINFIGHHKLGLALSPNPNDPPEVKMKY
jgi:hypothetical protein